MPQGDVNREVLQMDPYYGEVGTIYHVIGILELSGLGVCITELKDKR